MPPSSGAKPARRNVLIGSITGIALLIGIGAAIYSASRSVPTPTADCRATYDPILTPSAQDNSDQFFTQHADLQFVYSSLYTFYSPSVSRCVSAAVIEVA